MEHRYYGGAEPKHRVLGRASWENVINFINRMGVLTFTNVQAVKLQC
jgi:hypothetical protein